ncbi:SDR family NAD(P)-dependent oxidoreductase [Marinobacter sp. X15-166B]|uniref:SDR family NAD(P)-dependent oxidoreductase n=1 Tax=Marinobacter sp. X15-166B TaxID=1897620 RepID=UPI00085BD51C|nr:SDR family oxidoreductase [Marinobacter sp. X15-166B]OEY66057.1 2-deoxy-D-gluconate 3-dehydrogenase [Marinobacter sp. X15-166B]
MDNCFSLHNKVALVTGASSGLGQHFARVLARGGAAVVVAARRQDRLDALVADIAADGGTALAVPMDVTDAASIVAAFDRAEAQLGTVDVIVNNAGIGDPRAFLDTSEAAWDTMMDTNLKSAWRIAQEASKRLIAKDQPGCIINIASILGLRVAARLSHYAVAKAGVVQLTKALSIELARYKIRVNSIAPGYFKTEMNSEFFDADAGKNYIKQQVPMRRLGTLDELSGPLLLLASDAGSYMTGSVIVVDGGHSNNPL